MSEDFKKAIEKLVDEVLEYSIYNDAGKERTRKQFSELFAKAEQQWAVKIEQIKDEKNTKIEALQLAILTIYKPQITKLEKERSEQKKQLQTLIKEFPLPKKHPLLHFSVEEWLEKLEKFVELSKQS